MSKRHLTYLANLIGDCGPIWLRCLKWGFICCNQWAFLRPCSYMTSQSFTVHTIRITNLAFDNMEQRRMSQPSFVTKSEILKFISRRPDTLDPLLIQHKTNKKRILGTQGNLPRLIFLFLSSLQIITIFSYGVVLQWRIAKVISLPLSKYSLLFVVWHLVLYFFLT